MITLVTRLMLLVVFLSAPLLGQKATTAAAGDSSGRLGSRVHWARLRTTDRHWDIHSDHDAPFAEFIRKNTNLNIESSWYSADPSKIEDLCNYPFIYAKSLAHLRDPDQLANIREYLERGGFICIDACGTPNITGDIQVYFRRNCEFLKQLLPGAEIQFLPESHPIYSCYFSVQNKDLFTPDMGKHVPGPNEGFHGVFFEGRMVALISMSGLQCGWPQTPLRTPGCMKMMVNFYVHAMTATAAPPVESRNDTSSR